MAIGIRTSVRNHEAWMKDALGDTLVTADLREKHRRMRSGPFPFFRATYWRWAETVLAQCGEFNDAHPVLGVGDVHLENFGTWRDAEGRLVFGVNDFDEAAVMPWALDPLRLVTSALLAQGTAPQQATAREFAAAVLKGYLIGIDAPGAVLLDHRGRDRLRASLTVQPRAREEFWIKFLQPQGIARKPAKLVLALRHAMPNGGKVSAIWPRQAGVGSLGRPRLVLVAEWRGGPVLREAKALLPSAWTRARGCAPEPGAARIAAAPFRSPDPWFAIRDDIVLRRLSPNNRKLDAKAERGLLHSPAMLSVMGEELAAIHAGTPGAAAAIRSDIKRSAVTAKSLASAALTMAALTIREQATYAGG